MDIDFALVLVILVGVSGLLWLFDALLLQPGRRRAIANLQAQLPRWAEAGSIDAARYQELSASVSREPVPVEYAKSFFPVLAVVLVLRSFLVEPFQIPSASMVPTLRQGDFILVNKFSYGIRLPVIGTKILEVGQPQRGDVMVFFPPNDKRYFIKRVIGLPGDQITYKDKVLYINGQAVPQTLTAELPPFNPRERILREDLAGHVHDVRHDLLALGAAAQFDATLIPGASPGDFSVTVLPGHYFMMGDNRDNSQDSRFWGQMPERNIVGKAFAIWMHWDAFFSIPSFQRVGKIE